MQALLPGLLQHLVDRADGAVEHVALPGLVRLPLVGVHPGDHEDRVALVDQPLHHRLLRVEVEHVVLVDPGRHDQQRLARRPSRSSAHTGSAAGCCSARPPRRARRRCCARPRRRPCRSGGSGACPCRARGPASIIFRPRTRLSPFWSTVASSTSGFSAKKFAGFIASTKLRVRNAAFLRSFGSISPTEPTVSWIAAARQQVGLLDVVEDRVLRPFLVGEALVRPWPCAAASSGSPTSGARAISASTAATARSAPPSIRGSCPRPAWDCPTSCGTVRRRSARRSADRASPRPPPLSACAAMKVFQIWPEMSKTSAMLWAT